MPMTSLTQIAEELSTLNPMELGSLAVMMEDTWGIKGPGATLASANVAALGATPEQLAAQQALKAYEVRLVGYETKVDAIKAVRAILGLSLMDSKNIVESLPVQIKTDLDLTAAEELRAQLCAAGCQVELREVQA